MRKLKIFIKRKMKNGLRQGLCFNLALILLLECAWPSAAMALTGGPSQPEVQSFEPVGTSDMVDLFSGDFSYNIPLFDMDGYPMNISYHSGIGMDQEASWTGLGWNINAGVINRNMRGLPDDFNGDQVTKQQNVKKNQTIGISCGFSGELFGLDFASFSARLGLKYNNYTGIGIEKSFNVALTTSNKFGGSGCVSLGITSSSDDGLSLSPSVSLSQSTSKTENQGTKLGISVGTSFNSRGGLTGLTITPEITQNMNNSKNKAGKDVNHSVSHSLNGAHFNFMQSTYSPSLDFPMQNLSITASLKFGVEIYGYAGALSPTAYYTEQGQITKTIVSPAYGYMNSHNAQTNDKAMMDFNREKDGSFTSSTYNLPITNFTYDFYSVAGQGTGGSYRPFRSDVGHIFDVSSYSTSDGGTASVELGAGGIFKLGTDITVNSAYSHSGDWNSSSAAQTLAFEGTGNYAGYEPFYFKEANEKSVNSDPAFLTRYGGYGPVRPELDGSVKFDAKTTGNLLNKSDGVVNASNTNYRKARDKRNQSIITLTNKEVFDGMGLFGGNGGSGVKNSFVTGNITTIGHHIGQITSLNTDGKRYVYCLPVYNKEQQEMNFAVGEPVGAGSARPHSAGLVNYVAGTDNSLNNKMGLDNYYNNTIMPPFAHSYMLSAVLSPDYVDISGNGPSDDDLGNYTLFEYVDNTAGGDYKWRTPVQSGWAKYNQGLLSDANDDKGSIIYGTKQLFYLSKITSKNHTADFILTPRLDGKGVSGVDGGIGSGTQLKIDQIVIKSRNTNSVIKTVNFKYDYTLCPNTPNSSSGKLTLKKLYFTYQASGKGAYNSYNFTYGNANPAYNQEAYDRWGNYKSLNPPNAPGASPPALPNEYYPYTYQGAGKAALDADAAAWNLSKIELPSGGEINVDYESDDYAYVQDKQASQMYTYNAGTIQNQNTLTNIDNTGFTFKFQIPADAPANVSIQDFIPDNKMVFFKFKMCIKNAISGTPVMDYVPGYAEVDVTNSGISGNTGSIRFVPVDIKDNPGLFPQTCPIVKAAIQFGRLNASRTIYDQPNASTGIGQQVIQALVNSSFFNNLSQVIAGPNQYLRLLYRGTYADLNCSWIKLKNVSGHKYGGGSRVKSVKLKDNFATMTANATTPEATSEYGQLYDYTTVVAGKTISSGVASYEPQIGGEENSLKVPFFTETKRLLAPDDEHYVEAPFGECFYPSATIGYSEVKVRNYVPATLPTGTSLLQHGTGYTVNEFYTAKDFPTISDRTRLEPIQHKTDPLNVGSLLSTETKDYMTTSQGFYVELNDMHGKQKAIRTYNSYGTEMASTEYFYKCSSYGSSKRLTNTVSVIKPNGSVASADVGVFFDAVGDLREQATESETDNVNINIDAFIVIIPIAIVVPIPSFASDKTQFRSATVTKVVQRFGIIDKTVVKKEGSTVTNKDLAYDSETGETLLSQTVNDFDDPEYSFKYPAYWYNPSMGPASKNIGYSVDATFTAGKATLLAGQNLFIQGDEVLVTAANSIYKYWITKSLQNKIELTDMIGGTALNGAYTIKVVRSGYRNMQTMDMASITSLVNPISSISSNIYQKIISASAIEYGNVWGTSCDCINTIGNRNPYVNGTQGNYRPIRNYQFLTDRNQTNTQGNSNTRVDGLYNSYTPFYKNVGGKWVLNPYNWTFTSEVTEYSPYGQELENRDALGRYSAATFGFNQSLSTAVGSNTQYRELGYESFEDAVINGCADKHFKFDNISTATQTYYGTGGHTGKTSLVLSNNTGVTLPTIQMFKKVSAACYREDDCKLQVLYSATNSRYEITNGYAPYIIDVEKTGGTGNIVISTDGQSFTVNNVANYKCKIIVMDSKGCVINKVIQSPYTN